MMSAEGQTTRGGAAESTEQRPPSEGLSLEGADTHCQLNDLTLSYQVVFDWLDEVFGEPEYRRRALSPAALYYGRGGEDHEDR